MVSATKLRSIQTPSSPADSTLPGRRGFGPAVIAVMGLLMPVVCAQTTSKRPVDYANPLVGTAPLDNQKLIGNAPPAGEQLYSGFTSPGAVLQQWACSATDAAQSFQLVVS